MSGRQAAQWPVTPSLSFTSSTVAHPASMAAMMRSFSTSKQRQTSVMAVRGRGGGSAREGGAHHFAHELAIGASLDFRTHHAHHRAHVLRGARAGFGHGGLHDRL